MGWTKPENKTRYPSMNIKSVPYSSTNNYFNYLLGGGIFCPQFLQSTVTFFRLGFIT